MFCMRLGMTNNIECEREDHSSIRTVPEHVASIIYGYLLNTDHYIETSEYWIGIRLGNENFAIRLEQIDAPIVSEAISTINSRRMSYFMLAFGEMTITSVRDKPYALLIDDVEAQNLIPKVMICNRLNFNNKLITIIANITCINEEGDAIKTRRANVLTVVNLNEYIHNMDYYIESTDLWIGIKIGSSGSLTLNHVQENAPTILITRYSSSLDVIADQLDHINGTLIISIGANEIFRGPVSVFTYIRNYRIDFKPYILQHNGIDMNISRSQ
ncbi:uncharacterized protein LOC135927452 isoform X10 [Gordionus sp. m RMFG-2023]|uniref:uncharacterized protein LOC135927452 isoform X10 n=1 Tax=Gordionus sp. m RMFG-2023 TaxID=3053472 RepID=UPI0031FD7F64